MAFERKPSATTNVTTRFFLFVNPFLFGFFLGADGV